MVRIAALVVILCSFAWPLQGRGAKAKPDMLSEHLFGQARSAAEALPAGAAPLYLERVARSEDPAYPAQAEADFQSAFRQAAALGANTPGDPSAGFLAEPGESGAIRGLVAGKHFTAALDLIRRSGSFPQFTKAPLYSELIMAWVKLPAQRAVRLIAECSRADGSFPFAAASTLLARRVLSPGQGLTLAIEADRAAGNATDGEQIGDAVLYLRRAHELEPQTDSHLENAINDLLPTVAQQKPEQVRASEGASLLMLLREIDPERAQAVGEQNPVYAAPNRTPEVIHEVNASGKQTGLLYRQPLPQRLGRQAAHDPVGALSAAGALRGKTQRFLALAQVAWALRDSSRRDLAVKAATGARDLVTGDIVQANTYTVAELAAALHTLGVEGGEELARKCLDEEAARDKPMEESYQGLTGDGKARAVANLQIPAWEGSLVFGLAAAADTPDAVSGAEALPSGALQPLALAAVAATLAGAPGAH